MLVTKLSSKGQVVIPSELRKDMKEGTAFAVLRKKDLIVLKKLKTYTKRELAEMAELDRLWKEIDAGKYAEYTPEEFSKKLLSGNL